MKICFFTEIYFKGGLDTFLINIFNSWPVKDDQIYLACNASHSGIDNIIQKSPKEISINKYNRVFTSTFFIDNTNKNLFRAFIKRFLNLTYKIIEYPILFPWYLISLTIFFLRNDYDRLIIVNGGYPASLLCRCAVIAWKLSLKKQPAIMNFHNSANIPKWYQKPFEDLIDRMVEKYSKNIVSVSNNCLNSLNLRKGFIGSKKLLYIQNGIQDPSKESLNQPFLNTNNPYCLMLATYEPRKGHTFLLNAFKEVSYDFPELELRIHGDGSEKQKATVNNEINRLKLGHRVFLGDHVQDIASLYMNASILLVPSQEYESFGLTIIEAMAFGVPIVATDVGGMPEVLSDSNAGYICSKDDPSEFAEAIKKIIKDKNLSEQMSLNGRKTFVDKFTATKMANQYAKLIEN